MAEWSVVAAKIELFPHPDPETDSVLIGKVGNFQVVVNKNNGYKDGDIVIFAPERAVLPEELRPFYVNSKTGESYLTGPFKDRVKGLRLRGELSEGVTIPYEYVMEKLGEVPLDEDLSERLGITKYEPPIPGELSGRVTNVTEARPHFHKHDVEQFQINKKYFTEGEPVEGYEKIHGSQVNIYRSPEGNIYITSKGMAKQEITIMESESNSYWQGAKNSGILAFLQEIPKSDPMIIQLFGELIPVQSGYSYGQTKPTIRLFRMETNGDIVPPRLVKEQAELEPLAKLWVPLIYDGPFDEGAMTAAAKGLMEGVSGKKLHIAEGIVYSPVVPRKFPRSDAQLMVKILNPKYKSSDEDIS